MYSWHSSRIQHMDMCLTQWYTLWHVHCSTHIVTHTMTHCDTHYDIVTHTMTHCDTHHDTLWHTTHTSQNTIHCETVTLSVQWWYITDDTQADITQYIYNYSICPLMGGMCTYYGNQNSKIFQIWWLIVTAPILMPALVESIKFCSNTDITAKPMKLRQTLTHGDIHWHTWWHIQFSSPLPCQCQQFPELVT